MRDKTGFVSFGFRIFLYIVAGIVISDALLYYITDHNIGQAYYETLVVLKALKNSSYRITYSISAVIHAAMTVAIVFIALMMSHRIAGPMYRFGRVSEEVRDGNLNVQINLRESDYLKEHAEEFSSALSNMRGVLSAVKHKCVELERLSEGLDGDIDKVRHIKSEVSELRDGLRFFSINEDGRG